MRLSPDFEMVKAESDPLNVIPRRLSESDLFVKSKFVGLIYILPFLSLDWELLVVTLWSLSSAQLSSLGTDAGFKSHYEESTQFY